MENTSGDMTWLWTGTGAFTGLLVRGWSLHWTVRTLERTLELKWATAGGLDISEAGGLEGATAGGLDFGTAGRLEGAAALELDWWVAGGLGLAAGWTDERLADLSEPRPANLTDERPVDSQHSRRSRRTPTLNFSRLGRNDELRLPCRGKKTR